MKVIGNIMNMYNFNVHLGKCNILVGTKLYEQYKDEIEFSGTVSMISDDIFLQSCKDMIKDNKDIFPQYYNFNRPFHRKYDLLEKFFMFYSTCKNSFKGTYVLLNAYFDNDILNFYENFIKVDEEFVKNVFSVVYLTKKRLEKAENNYNLLKEIGNCLMEYIDKYIDERYKELFVEMIRYELLLCDFSMRDINSVEAVEFKFDVSEIRRSFDFIYSLNQFNERKNIINLKKMNGSIDIKKQYIN